LLDLRKAWTASSVSQRIADFWKRARRTLFAAQPIGRIEDARARARQVTAEKFNAHPANARHRAQA
jgi:hypothetical protein